MMNRDEYFWLVLPILISCVKYWWVTPKGERGERGEHPFYPYAKKSIVCEGIRYKQCSPRTPRSLGFFCQEKA